MKLNAKALAMDQLRKDGYLLVFNAETKKGKFTADLLGVIDILAYSPAKSWLAVQVTTSDHFEDHAEKIAASEEIRRLWVDFGFRFEVWLYPSAAERRDGEDRVERIPMERFVSGASNMPVKGRG